MLVREKLEQYYPNSVLLADFGQVIVCERAVVLDKVFCNFGRSFGYIYTCVILIEFLRAIFALSPVYTCKYNETKYN